jgi:phosphoglycolate phosphatase-like HAD superfamily hydrolase
MKNITLSADEKRIEAAREWARAEHTTLNAEFRRWLERYARRQEQMQHYDEVINALQDRASSGLGVN